MGILTLPVEVNKLQLVQAMSTTDTVITLKVFTHVLTIPSKGMKTKTLLSASKSKHNFNYYTKMSSSTNFVCTGINPKQKVTMSKLYCCLLFKTILVVLAR